MPHDTQIFVGADRDGNSDYELPKNAEIVVKAVHATFTDNGAGADWCPAVVMLSDSGHKIVTAINRNETVTAGDDAEASFFPGGRVSGAAAVGASSLPCAFLNRNTSFTLTPWGGAYSVISWEAMLTNDSSVFSWPFAANNAVAGIAKPGVYRMVYEYRTSGTDFPAGPGTIISQPFVSAGVAGATSEVPSVNSTTGALYRGDQSTGFPYGPISEEVFNLTAAAHVAVEIAWQATAGSATILSAVCFIYRIGDVLA